MNDSLKNSPTDDAPSSGVIPYASAASAGEPPPAISRLQWTVAALAVVGVAFCFWFYPLSFYFNPRYWGTKKGTFFEDDTEVQQVVLAAIGIFSLIPLWVPILFRFRAGSTSGKRTQPPGEFSASLLAAHAAVARGLDAVRHPSVKARRWTALAVAIGSGLLLFALGALRGRLMLPIWHDENMYRMQTTFLAHGKFCMPGLPLPDFFDSPYILVRGVYAPVYFIGTALLHVPAAWLGLPYILTPLIIAALSLALLYRIVTELLDGVAGLLAVVLMISLAPFLWLSMVEMSHSAGMMWGLVTLWCWLKWRVAVRPGPRIGWALLGGLAAGWYGITRPLDGLSCLLPVAIAWAWDLRRVGWKSAAITVLAVVLAATPLLVMQLAFDRAVTGNAFEPPLDRYNRIYFNAKSLGLQKYDPAFRPPTPVRLIRQLYTGSDAPDIKAFTTAKQAISQWWTLRLPTTLGATVPSVLLLALVPIGLVGLTDRRRLVLWSMAWCYMVGMGFFYIFLGHYTNAAAPGIVFAVLLGAFTLERAWPNLSVLRVLLPLAIFGLAVESIAHNQQAIFEPFPGKVSRMNYFTVTDPKRVEKPAIVLYRLGPTEEIWEEPVYNWDVLWPDDAPIIRAHDLGEVRNRELYAYYAKRQPSRTVYLVDRASLTLTRLGNVKELAVESR